MMNKNLYCLSAIIWMVCLFFSHTTYSQISSQEIDQLVKHTMEEFIVAGIAVAVVKDGEIIHQKGYGVKSIETNHQVDEHTNFAIASNSKAFTTAALSILVDEGKLSWLDKVKDHIPEFKMYNAYVTENFNIQDLLTHRSGLGLGVGDLMMFPDGGDYSIKDVLASFQYFKPQSAFRTKFDYDNLLYLVAGEVIARVSGMPWEQFIETRILQPLNMESSYSAYVYIPDNSNLATPHLTVDGALHVIESEVYDPVKINGAAGGIYSNVNDLSNWMLMQLNKGKYGTNLEKQLFSVANQDEMWKIHTTLNTNKNPRYNSHFTGYGLGWRLSDLKGNMSVSHTGGLAGMLSKTLLIPDLNLGVVVLTNTWSGGGAAFTAITQTIVDRYLGLEDFDWVQSIAQQVGAKNAKADSVVAQVWQTVRAADASHVHTANYVGIYEDNWFGQVEIYAVGEQLYFKSLRSPKLSGPMAYYKANAFAIRWTHPHMEADAFAIFFLDEEGKAQRIQMKGISPDIDFSYDFHDLNLIRVN